MRNSITVHSPEGAEFERQFLISPGLRPHPGSPICNLPSTLYVRSVQSQPETQPEQSSINCRTIQIIQTEYRKRLEHHRLRNMFIAQLCKAVIRRHEEIVAADAVLLPKRWTMRSNTSGHLSPDYLSFVRKSLPRLDGPLVKFSLLHLFSSSCKIRIRLAPEIADAIPVIEGHIADRRPAIRELRIWNILGHIRRVLWLQVLST